MLLRDIFTWRRLLAAASEKAPGTRKEEQPNQQADSNFAKSVISSIFLLPGLLIQMIWYIYLHECWLKAKRYFNNVKIMAGEALMVTGCKTRKLCCDSWGFNCGFVLFACAFFVSCAVCCFRPPTLAIRGVRTRLKCKPTGCLKIDGTFRRLVLNQRLPQSKIA